ncbi:EH signature domain-containing protein [Acidaminococcus timonensis]|uniref:EH signature domain-containing protein n=1 Tax=Acidaminococcus timonensis TaxID=1871002 RepID=UPI00307FB855
MDKSLRNNLERLKSFKIRLPEVCLHPGKPVELEKWLKKTVSDSGRRPALDPVTMEEIYTKVKGQERGKKVPLDLKREVPFLPVLLTREKKEKPRFYEVLLQDILQVIQEGTPRSARRNTFRNLVFAYFTVYGQPNKGERLQKCISLFLQKDPELLRSVLYLRNRKQLLKPNGHKLLTREIQKQRSFHKALEEFRWPMNLWYGAFSQWAVKDFFQLEEENNWDELFGVLKEICEDKACRNMVPYAAEKMIYLTDRSCDGNREKEVRILLFQALGDPRDPGASLNWVDVEERAQEIFLSWLKKNDLNLFFTIISKTVGRVSTSENMWKYRKNFWEKYLDAMYYTRVFLGPEAEWIARRMDLAKQGMGFGRLNGSGDSQRSLLMFSIGDYVFIEASHNGKLRVWKRGKEPLPFYQAKYSYKEFYYVDVTQASNVEADFVHSSSETGSWQRKVNEWVRRHCGVRPKESTWR